MATRKELLDELPKDIQSFDDRLVQDGSDRTTSFGPLRMRLFGV